MKMHLLLLLLLFPMIATTEERHVKFDHPGQEGSSYQWVPVILTDFEKDLLAKKSDPPKTALDFYLLLSGRYFRNIASGTERRITFIDRKSLTDQYLHADYTIPSIDAGAFSITVRLFGGKKDPIIAINHYGGAKRLFAAKENGPLGLWSISLSKPEFWRYEGDAFEEGGALIRLPESILPDLAVEDILDRYRNHFKAHLNHQTQKKSIHLTYELLPTGEEITVTGRENFMSPAKRYEWAQFTFIKNKFQNAVKTKADSHREK